MWARKFDFGQAFLAFVRAEAFRLFQGFSCPLASLGKNVGNKT
uniref:Uncharacterized protein n=1 Tax=Arundo donax TaxID=35708 RepID=A0A0A8Y0L4_ARUDO